jgi:GTP-binding protein
MMKKRVVAILGRPNVGKSALFNRLAGRRVAIVHAQSGVTRDRLMREVSWEDSRFTLVDTGGICTPDSRSGQAEIEAGIRRQAEAALEDAAVVLLVTDIQTGVHPMDAEVAELIRRSGCRAYLVANKADGERQDASAADFARLGFPVFPVSALQNRGISDLMSEVVGALPESENETLTTPLRVAIVGRPNVGKSSYINRLLRSERVIVSEVPGTTRDSIEVPFRVGGGHQARHYLLVDTAGIRSAGKIDTTVERFSLFRSEQSIKEANVVVLVLDTLQGPTAHDKKIAALINEHRRGCVILVNKWDLAGDEVTQRQYGPAVVKTMPFMGHCPVVFASAKDGYNVKRTVEAIDAVAAQVTGTLPTGILNRTIQDAVDKVSPPALNGRRLKLYYATQVGTDPIRIRVYVNNADLIRPAYETYLIKALRAKFGLEGAPVLLQFQTRNSKYSGDDAGSGGKK